MNLKSYVWGLNERYYIDSEGNIEESDGESPPQSGTIPKFVATELLRLASIEKDFEDVVVQLQDLLNNSSCSCSKPCPRCQVSIDQSKELLARIYSDYSNLTVVDGNDNIEPELWDIKREYI